VQVDPQSAEHKKAKIVSEKETLYRLVKQDGEIVGGVEINRDDAVIVRPPEDSSDRIWLAILKRVSPTNEKVILLPSRSINSLPRS
jgi:hypothetical protein